jgi:hypothetical protein
MNQNRQAWQAAARRQLVAWWAGGAGRAG